MSGDATHAAAPRPRVGEQALLRPGETCWRIERAERLAFLIDGADYFAALRSAILQARHSILILAWELHSRGKRFPI